MQRARKVWCEDVKTKNVKIEKRQGLCLKYNVNCYVEAINFSIDTFVLFISTLHLQQLF